MQLSLSVHNKQSPTLSYISCPHPLHSGTLPNFFLPSDLILSPPLSFSSFCCLRKNTLKFTPLCRNISICTHFHLFKTITASGIWGHSLSSFGLCSHFSLYCIFNLAIFIGISHVSLIIKEKKILNLPPIFLER